VPDISESWSTQTGGLTKGWTYSDPERAYTKYCISCKNRAASRPMEACPHPQHLAYFERARLMKKSPPTRFKSKNGEGNYMRDGPYRRALCRSCRTDFNSHPSPTCSLDAHGKYYEANLEKSRVKNWEIKSKVVKLLGSKCVNCGITDIRVLQVNHRGSDGHAPWERSSTKFFNWILKGKLPLQAYDLRCANCNVLYEYEVGHLVLPSTMLTTNTAQAA
jgi:hypothetical protein